MKKSGGIDMVTEKNISIMTSENSVFGEDVFCKKKELSQYCIIAISYGIFILLFYQNYIVNLVVLMFQIAYFVYLLLKKRYVDYLAMYIIFSSMSLEFEYMSGEFYGWKTFRFMGITVAMWFILPLFGIAVINILANRKIKFDEVSKFTLCFVLLNCIAIVMGIVMLLTNDNNILNQRGVVSQFVLAIYENLTRIMVPAVTFAFFLKEGAIEVIKKVVIAILIGITFQEVLSVLTGIMGTMWTDNVLMVGPIQTFTPFLLLFAIFKRYGIGYYASILGIIACFLALKYSYGSGQFIILFSVPVWMLLAIIERKKVIEFRYMIILGAIFVPVVFAVALNINYGDSIKYKLDQAISLLKIWNENWLSSLPVSARFRIEEIRGIASEFIRKPYYFILGKGYLGTFTDSFNYFFSSSEAGSTHAFSQFEWNLKAFYSVHESFNKLFLSNGLLGIICFFKVLFKGIKNAGKSPFIAIGIMWFLWYWGYSTTYSYFGMLCLFLGVKEISYMRKVSEDE